MNEGTLPRPCPGEPADNPGEPASSSGEPARPRAGVHRSLDARGNLRADLIRDHARAVLAVCLANVRNFHEAEDLMQETFTRALAGLDSLRDHDKARPWLLQIARRLCIDHSRRRRPAALPDNLAASPGTHDPRIERLHAALARLPDEYRETISLYYLDGQDCAGAAAALGISPGAVRMRLLRGRMMLYDLLAEDKR